MGLVTNEDVAQARAEVESGEFTDQGVIDRLIATQIISPAHITQAKAIQFGTVWINEHFTLVSEMPHGGFKESGYGKDGSMYALEDYTVVKHVMLKI